MSNLNHRDGLWQLPSEGTGYDPQLVPLIEKDHIKARPLTAGHHRYLAPSFGQTYKFLLAVLDKFIVEPRIQISELYFGDVMALMCAFRICTYKDGYKLPHVCEACNLVQEGRFNLGELPCEYASEKKQDNPEWDPENVPVKLTDHDGKVREVVMRLWRLRDEKLLVDTYEQVRKSVEFRDTDPDFDKEFLRHALLIKSIDGKDLRSPSDVMEKFHFLEKMPPDVMVRLDRALAKASFGVNTKVEFVCTNCKHKNVEILNLTPEFFRPMAEDESGD